ncbi:MAG: MMPL family transporter, partial [Myxococcota bacterium]|nr:MMPL family transporter [Myxococcota bacterium]
GGYKREDIHVVGFPAVISALLDETLFNLVRLFPMTALLLLLAVWLLFRRLWPAFVSSGVAMIAVLWTMGIAIAMDPRITVMHTIAPVVILIVSFSDVIHLVSAYLMELEDDKDKEQAIIDATTDVGRACWYTSLTTFTGFVSMSFVPTPVFRQLGVILGAGVGIALILAMTVVPILLYYLPRPGSWRVGATSRTQGWIDGALDTMARWTTHQPWRVISAWIVVIIVTIIGLFHFHIETRFSDRMDDDHQVNVDRRWFAEHFAQANYLSIYVEAEERDALLDPELMQGLARLQAEVDQLPQVDDSQSVVNLLQLMHEELAGADAETSLPNTREGLTQYLLMFEMSGGRELDRLLDFDRRTALINVRLNSEAIRETYDTGVQIMAMAEEHLQGRAEVKPTGAIYLTGEWLGEILAGQSRGLIFTVIVIAFMMMIALRSVRVGLWSMLPNVLPLFVLGGALGLLYDAVDSDTLMLGMLAIGIGVDDTIHFMMRYRSESLRTDDTALALKRTYGFAGRAIVMTTLVLAMGFAPCLFSSYYSFWIMGSMLPFVLVVALLADLLLVPAMVTAGLLSFNPRGAEVSGDTP